MTKDHALKRAKIDYLKNSNKGKMHPYYWAAFVQFGNINPVLLETPFYWKYIFGGVGAILLFIIFRFYFKNKTIPQNR